MSRLRPVMISTSPPSPVSYSCRNRALANKFGTWRRSSASTYLCGVAGGWWALPKRALKLRLLIGQILKEADNLKRLSSQFVTNDRGWLTIATTHNQACYVLPSVLLRFARDFPHVAVELRQGTPQQVVDMLLRREADFSIATEAVSHVPDVVAVPCFNWRHVAIVPEGHALAGLPSLTLADIADFPIVTYNSDFSGRSGGGPYL